MEKNNSHKKAFRLDELPKKDMFSVPDGYFDKLPTIIQAKALESTKKKFLFSQVGFLSPRMLRVAIPSLLLLVMAGYFGYKYQQTNTLDAKIELMLADVSTKDMVSYLNATDISSDDLLELVSFEGEKIDDFTFELENVSDEELELLINDFDLQDLQEIEDI